MTKEAFTKETSHGLSGYVEERLSDIEAFRRNLQRALDRWEFEPGRTRHIKRLISDLEAIEEIGVAALDEVNLVGRPFWDDQEAA